MQGRSARQVTQRPGSSSFATSVKTLTGGSQATDFSISRASAAPPGGCAVLPWRRERGPAPRCRQVRRRSAMVRTWPGATLVTSRLALAARLIPSSGTVAATCRRPMRSWPDASWAAPNVAETAKAAKIPLRICDMSVCPSPHGDHRTQRTKARGSARFRSLNRVRKYFEGPWNNSGGLGVIPAAGYSPCPIDRRRRVRPW